MKSATAATKPAAKHTGITVRKILVPTDFSPASKKSLSYALRFAQGLNSEITLLHVLEPETPLTLAGRPAATAFSE
ncbi:MAG TPA: universal stress protein, partial [Candidatus Udaeobacter sp.]|nr:universal stress protein [Candidatus Udaeobacter sp.]